MGELQQAIIVERFAKVGYCAFMGTNGHLKGFWLLMVVCWEYCWGLLQLCVGGVANDPHPLPHHEF